MVETGDAEEDAAEAVEVVEVEVEEAVDTRDTVCKPSSIHADGRRTRRIGTSRNGI